MTPNVIASPIAARKNIEASDKASKNRSIARDI